MGGSLSTSNDTVSSVDDMYDGAVVSEFPEKLRASGLRSVGPRSYIGLRSIGLRFVGRLVLVWVAKGM